MAGIMNLDKNFHVEELWFSNDYNSSNRIFLGVITALYDDTEQKL